eukprot:TRINITY_DN20562_c0_g1_i1.p2 TRINITY_DN20562_c0_g1~~TRINITY_DN20562_c0_g1_i1.p2  ORF type:complete len:486 (+),score=-86.29 TRINITY_DN20562_c0_g1_i1:382-1839(+)
MHHYTVKTLSQMLKKKAVSSVELTQHFLKRIRQYNPILNGFITVTEKTALSQAKAADEALQKNKTGVTALTGIPLVHKDIFCTRDIKTTAASKMLDNFIPPYNATLVEKLDAQGTVLLGKTNMDEFAMGASNENSYYGCVKNPWNPQHTPGGSSGGTAATIAAGLAPIGTGTDTGGSIRQPAAFCGITGIKPSYGRISRFGMISFASSLDQAGPMGKTVEDVGLLLTAIAGHDSKDSTSLPAPTEDYCAQLGASLAGRTIGLPKEYFSQNIAADIQKVLEEAMSVYKKLGVRFVEVSLPHVLFSPAVYYAIAPAEASSNLARYDGIRYGYSSEATDLKALYLRSRSEGFGKEVQRRIILGNSVLFGENYTQYFQQAQKVRRKIYQDFKKVFQEVDLLLAPTTATTAFPLGEKHTNPVVRYVSDLFTIGANLAGLPALSLPCGFSQGLPLGMQLIANNLEESLLLNAGHQFQLHTDWHLQQPAEYK